MHGKYESSSRQGGKGWIAVLLAVLVLAAVTAGILLKKNGGTAPTEPSVPETSAVRISVRAGGEQFSFSTDEIMYFTTIGKKLALKTSDCQTVEFYGTLKDIESKYSEYFLRCHSGFLVNKKYIRRFSKSSIKLKNSAEELPVSKKYVKNVTNFAHLS